MIRYAYNRQVEPPAPFVYASLRCPETGTGLGNLPAQIHTAAYRTVIPGSLVALLGLVPLDELPVTGLGGQVFLLPTYRLEVTIHTLPSQTVEVFAHDDEPFVLLGRDVLNQHRLLLNGPGQTLEIG
jgi:hypothetical protein